MLLRSRKLVASAIAITTLLWATALLAQNTAPVPTTFSIISPNDGNAASLINTDYEGAGAADSNKTIFYGGDYAYTGANNARGFNGYLVGGNIETTRKARGNKTASRLTLGGTESGADPAYPTVGRASVVNLGSWFGAAYSFDSDDLGGDIPTYPNYQGANGFIAINEGDTLEIQITGFIDPNNQMVGGENTGAADGTFPGSKFKSQNGDGVAGNYRDDDILEYKIENKPAGATFTSTGLFRWVPSFVQGDGGADDSQHGGYWFVDANISNGNTSSETVNGDEGTVGPGAGELKDSLYVIRFLATDDSNQGNNEGMDSLFILVNDSLPNPPPAFTKRTILFIDSLGQQTTKTHNFGGATDSIFSVYEGDSVIVTYFATDQDSAQGEVNDIIAFGMLWSDSLRGVAKGGATTDSLAGFNQFIARSGTVDTLVADTVSTTSGSTATSYRIKLQLPYSLATDAEKADTLIVMVSDGTTIVADTMALKVRNTNRSPIWDLDTTSTPTDSALAYSFTPETVDPDSVQAVSAITLNNNQTDSTQFSSLVYDPDFLVGDSLGYPLVFSASGNHPGVLNTTTGLNVWLPTEVDTITYSWTVTATDADTLNPKATANPIRFRVAPAPTITSVEPAIGSVNTEFIINGSGFGLYDKAIEDTSRVQFYATTNGVRQNIDANIISWSKTKIVASVPSNVPASPLDATLSYLVPDTIIVRSAIYGGFDTYPFVVVVDSAGVENMEITSLTSTSAIIRYRSNYTGADSVVVANQSDTLDIHPGGSAWTVPVFVEYNGGMSSLESTVQVFKDQTSASDGVHVIQLTNLSPGTLYRFFIATADGVYIADTLSNQNGPYQPQKINLDDVTQNSNQSAFRLRTLPANAGSGELYSVTGNVFYSGGAADGATVTLKMVSALSIADTSLTLTTTVGADSSWLLDLANLKNSDGSNFAHVEGDYMLLEVDGAEKGFEQYDTLRAATAVNPMTIKSLKLLPLADYTMNLKTGLNLIGLPVKLVKGQVGTAEEFLDEIEGGSPSLTRYVTATGSQETIARSVQGVYIGADDFTLEAQQGYYVNVSSKTDISLTGRVYSDSLPTVTFAGAGLYYVTAPGVDNDLFYSWDANQILTFVPEVKTVHRFDASLQQIFSYIRVNGSYKGTNFDLGVGEGFIFELSTAGSWDPNGPGVMLASSTGASVSTEPAASIVIEPAGNSQSSAFAKLSNLSSSAATLTWSTGNSSAGKLVLTSLSDGGTREFDSSAGVTNDQLNYSIVTGLKPGEQYSWRIEGAAESLTGTFTSAQVGSGMRPYILYGRLVDAAGQPLTGVTVTAQVASENSESSTLSSITDKDGYWMVNLANLKNIATGDVYQWEQDDEVRMSALGSGWSSSFDSRVGASSPFNVAGNLITDDVNTDVNNSNNPVGPSLPKAFNLAQNYPNPFNPSTTIKFSVPEGQSATRARLTVFNLRGQEVALLVNRSLEPGDYTVQWDGNDRSGRRVPSGVYFYRLNTPQFNATRKMVILK
jgi:hypothetical protein